MSEIQGIRRQEAYEHVYRAGQSGMTLQEVAKAMKKPNGEPMKVTPYLTGMLDQLVTEGYLRKEPSMVETARGLRMGWRYYTVSRSE